jgi:hypothetical protein
MKLAVMVLSLLVCLEMLVPAKVIPLPGGMATPDSIKVDQNHIYISDFPFIYIFSRKDFRLIKKFGRKGEGPQEFMFVAIPYVRDDHLIVCDYVKALFYTKEGNYKKEIKSKTYTWRELMPVGNKFVGKGRFDEGKIDYIGLNLYDAALNKEKRIVKYKMWAMGGQGKASNIIDYRNIQYVTYEDKIFVKTDQKDFIIEVYDNSGKKLYTINREYERVGVSDADIKRYHDYFRTYSRVRRNYENMKHTLGFGKLFPAIRTFTIADRKIYVVTFKKKNGDSEVIILNLKGKLLKKIFLPLFKRDEVFYRSIENNIFKRRNNSTFAIKDGKLYQIIENEENEETQNWEAHVTNFE